MSDLTRLRKRLRSLEYSGKRLKAELGELDVEIASQGVPMTRSQERQVAWLNKILDEKRREYAATRAKLAAEERRLVENPAGFLRFT